MSAKTSLTVNNAIERPSQAKHPRVYQIDFTAVASGKRIASTKRRVRWRFGFANPEALANGQTGTACRGEEHDITLVWSITSGKRLILADGQEVHYSSTRGNKLDFSWTMRGNHVLKIVAHASPPLSASPGFRQYDFYVDGQSFFVFPKVFRLGLAPAASAPRSSAGYNNYSLNGTGSSKSTRQNKSGVAAVETPNTYDEEQAYLQEAIKNSLQETGPPLNFSNNNVSTEGQNLLMDFMDDNTTQISAPGQAGAASALPPSTFPPPTSYGVVPQQHAYGTQQTPYPPVANYNSAIVPMTIPGTSPSVGQQKAADQWGNQPAPPVFNNAAPQSTPVDPWTAQPNATVVSSNYVNSFVPQVPPISDPWGAHNAALSPAAPLVSDPVPDPWGPQNTLPGNAPAVSDPWEVQAAPMAHGTGQAPNSVVETPTAVVDVVTNPTPPTPSSIGFASPQGQVQSQNSVVTGLQLPNEQPGFISELPVSQSVAPLPNANDNQQEKAEALTGTEQKVEASTVDPALFTMSGLSGQVSATVETDPNASLADQAYAKYANMGEFDLVSKSTVVKDNPFEIKSPIESVSLQDMKKNGKSEPKKNIMNDPSGALVVAPTQTGNNWGQQAGVGSYGQQSPYGQQSLGHAQQPQSTLGQQMQQSSYGQQQQQQAQSAQPAHSQQPSAFGYQSQSYGQPPPLQQQTPNLQQNYGQSYTQQPPPPLQQNPYGSFSQQQY